MRTRFRIVSAYFLIVVGLILCPFPIIPGWPIVAAGIALLGPEHPLVRRLRAWYLRARTWLAKKGIGTAPPPAAEPAQETGQAQ